MLWNDALAAHFFNDQMAGRSVFLYATDELIDRIADSIDSTRAEFIDAVKSGPPWLTTTRDGLCQKALRSMRGWRTRGLDFPPYVAYLSLFVYAGGVSGDFAPHAYYPRLRHLLDLESGGALSSFDHMLELWDDLERWSVQDRGGLLGRFTATISGSWIHVGLPLAQTILSEDEREALPTVFAAAGLDPEDNVTSSELSRLVVQYAGSTLRRRTTALLSTTGANEIREALTEAIAFELAEWDRSSPEVVVGNHTRPVRNGSIRISLQIDPLSRTLISQLRATLAATDQDDVVTVREPTTGEALEIAEDIPGWSFPLRTNDSTVFDASRLDWRLGSNWASGDAKVRYHFGARDVRLFIDASSQGLSGYLECHSIPGARSFLVAFADAASELTERWLAISCVGALRIPIDHGLPEGWRLYHVDAALDDMPVRNAYSWMRMPDAIRIRVRGGVRAAAGLPYLRFALPNIEILGNKPEDFITINGLRATPSGDGEIRLPRGIGDRVQVEVRRETTILARRSIFIADEPPSTGDEDSIQFDIWGNLLRTPGQPAIRGALVHLADSPHSDFEWRFPFLSCGEPSRWVLLGPTPGQITDFPAEPLPDTWEPNWAIEALQRPTVVYCARPNSRASVTSDENYSNRRINRWAELLWHRRKRITIPALRRIRDQFKSLQERARRV